MDVTHEAVREALLDLEAHEALAETMQAHLSTCDECRAFGQALAMVDTELAVLPSFAPPPELLERTEQAVSALPREREREPAGSTSSLFGAILTGLLGGLWSLVELLIAPFRKPTLKTWAIAVPALAALALFFAGAWPPSA